ncbi:hypothetical protein Leryth_019302 [Lithospermum erythrorhizon]|nr:hypothetical protein Leryth_019302 [Lithospermum erythrorhizon]
MHFDQNNFLQLKSLEILGMSEMEELVLGENSLPNLIELGIDRCNELKIVPEDGLKYLHNLRELSLGDSMSSFKNMCQMHRSQYPQVKIVQNKFNPNTMMINILKIPFSMMRTLVIPLIDFSSFADVPNLQVQLHAKQNTKCSSSNVVNAQHDVTTFGYVVINKAIVTTSSSQSLVGTLAKKETNPKVKTSLATCVKNFGGAINKFNNEKNFLKNK